MKKIVQAITPIQVEVNDHLYLIERPSVRQALIVLAASDAVAEGDEESYEEILSVIRGWLPIGLVTIFCSTGFPKSRVIQILTAVILAGMSKKDTELKADVDALKNKAKEVDWFEIIGTYATAFNMSPTAVLDESWHLFSGMVLQIDKLTAREQMRNAAWYGGAKVGKLDAIMDRAKGKKKEDTIPAYVEPSQEWYDRQYAAIKVLNSTDRKFEA